MNDASRTHAGNSDRAPVVGRVAVSAECATVEHHRWQVRVGYRIPNRILGLLPGAARGAGSLLHQSLLALGISLLGSLLAFVAQAGLARAMSAHQYGLYAYVFAWVSLLSNLATLGFEQGLLKFASVFRERREFDALHASVSYAERCSTMTSAALVLLIAAALWLFRARLSGDMTLTLALGLLVIPVTALMRVRSSVVRVLGRLTLSLIPGTVLRELILALAAVAMLTGVVSMADASVAMGFVLLASVLGLLGVSVGQRQSMPDQSRSPAGTRISAVREGAARVWLRPTLFLLLFTTTNLLLKRTDLLVIGWLLGPNQAGVYAVAMYVASLLALPVTAIGTAFAPVIATLHAEQRTAVLQEKASSAARWAIAAGLVPSLALLLFAPTLLRVIGNEYVAGSNVLRILSVGNLLMAAAGPVQLLMTMTGDERRAAIVHVLFAVTNFVVMLASVETFGLEGGALASVASVLSFKIALMVLVRRRIGVWSAPLWSHVRPGTPV